MDVRAPLPPLRGRDSLPKAGRERGRAAPIGAPPASSWNIPPRPLTLLASRAVPPPRRGEGARAMTALGKLFRTTAFKLSLAYLVVFALFAFAILGYVAWNARRVLDDQIVSTIEAEITGLREQYQHRRHPPPRLRRRAPLPRARRLALPRHEPAPASASPATSARCRPAPSTARARARSPTAAATTRTPRPTAPSCASSCSPAASACSSAATSRSAGASGDVIRRAFGLSLALIGVLGFAGAWFVTRRVLNRVDAMTDTTRTIMAGDLSGRLAIAGTGDELDRLAQNLNAMLDRIGELMAGMKEVSDNIAHDLKTPLTRLRNRADEALRNGEDARRSCARRSRPSSRRATTSSASSTRS